jgi:hypothetical protein
VLLFRLVFVCERYLCEIATRLERTLTCQQRKTERKPPRRSRTKPPSYSRKDSSIVAGEKSAVAPKPDLTGIPAQIADFVADMLVQGSSRDAINSVIYGCLEHKYRSFDFAKSLSLSREAIDKGANEWVGKHADEWSDALIASSQTYS